MRTPLVSSNWTWLEGVQPAHSIWKCQACTATVSCTRQSARAPIPDPLATYEYFLSPNLKPYPTNHTPHQPARPRRGPPCRCYSVFKHSMPLAAEEPIELEAGRSERYLPCASLVFFHFFKPITSPAFRPRPTVINLPPLLPLPPPPPNLTPLFNPTPTPTYHTRTTSLPHYQGTCPSGCYFNGSGGCKCG